MADPRTKVVLSTGAKLFPTVNYELLSEGYSETYADGQPSITIRARTRWGVSYDFIANMTGVAGVDATRTSGLTRYIPASYYDTSYAAAIETSGDGEFPFLGWWCTGAKLIGTHGELACQDQVTGALVPAIKPLHALVSGTDYNAATGELYDTGFSGNKPVLTGIGFAEYELTFEPLQYEVRTDAEMDTLDAPLNGCELSRYVIRRYRFGGNNFTLQPGSLHWRDYLLADGANSTRSQINSEAVRPFPNANVIYTWLNVPIIPWSAITNCIGKVNASETGAAAPSGKFDYRPDWQGNVYPLSGTVIDGFLPGTLLFEGVSDITPKVTAAGQMLYDITYNFFYRPDGHNKIYRAATDSFERVVRVSTKNDPNSANWKDLLDEATFSSLFVI